MRFELNLKFELFCCIMVHVELWDLQSFLIIENNLTVNGSRSALSWIDFHDIVQRGCYTISGALWCFWWWNPAILNIPMFVKRKNTPWSSSVNVGIIPPLKFKCNDRIFISITIVHLKDRIVIFKNNRCANWNILTIIILRTILTTWINIGASNDICMSIF